MTSQGQRIRLLIRILEPGDYDFFRKNRPEFEKHFRIARIRIFRRELMALAMDSLRSYRVRLARINRAARWGAYPALVLSTLSILVALGKLWVASVLFSRQWPMIVNVGLNANRFADFLSVESLSAEPRNSPA